MGFDPTISAHGAEVILAYLESHGVSRTRLCDAVGIDPRVLADIEGRVHGSVALALWAEAARRRGRSAGVEVGAHAAAASPTLASALVLSAPTLAAGLDRLARFERVFHDAPVITLCGLDDDAEDEDVSISLGSMIPGVPAPALPVEFAFSWFVHLARRYLEDTRFAPLEVAFAHRFRGSARERDRIAEALGCDVWFATGENTLTVARDDLGRRGASASPHTLHALEAHLMRALESRERDLGALRPRVAELVARTLPEIATLESVAELMATSPRTLQRDLGSEGTSFRVVRDEVRAVVARSLLAAAQASVAEVAFATGFADVTSFRRAFKAWTGLTPTDARAAALRTAPS